MTRYEPTSHEYLYEMDREQLFALFVSVVAVLDSKTGVANCVGAQREGTMRIARAVQERTGGDTSPRGRAIGKLATMTRIVASTSPSDERYDDYLRVFHEDRAALGDLLPPTPKTVAMPNDLAALEAELDDDDEVDERDPLEQYREGDVWRVGYPHPPQSDSD